MFKISIIYLYVLKIKIYLFKSLNFSNEWKFNSMRKAYQEKQEGIRNQGWRRRTGTEKEPTYTESTRKGRTRKLASEKRDD